MAAREERPREATPQPEPGGSIWLDLAETEAAERMVRDAAGQALALGQQLGRSASQDHESCELARSVGQDTQCFEQLGLPLDLVEDHPSPQTLQCELWVLQRGSVLGALEVEERHGAGAGGRSAAREGGLADRARAEKVHDGELTQRPLQLPQVARSADSHAGNLGDDRRIFKVV